MHELGIVFHIIRTVEDVARQNDVTHIRRRDAAAGRGLRRGGELSAGLLEVGGGEIRAFCRRGADRGDHLRRDRVRGLRPTVPHRAVWPHLPPLPEPRTHLSQGHEMLIKEIEAVETEPTAPGKSVKLHEIQNFPH
mgnify:CR=1 FL=1